MSSKDVAIALGFNTANAMFESIGYDAKKFHKLKESSKELKLCEIILEIHKLGNPKNLLGFISSVDSKLLEENTELIKRLDEIHTISMIEKSS